MLNSSSAPLIFQHFLSVLLFGKRHRGIVCCLPALSCALSPWLTRDNYAPLSSYCQAQFATQIKWAAFEERGGQGEGENERATEREGQRQNNDRVKTNQQTKQRNAATPSFKDDFWIRCTQVSFGNSRGGKMFGGTPVSALTEMCVY